MIKPAAISIARAVFHADEPESGSLAVQSRSSAVRTITLATVIFLFSVVALYSATIDLGFSADGAYYFARILDHAAFMNPSWSRLHADLVSQWPLVAAARIGVTDLAVLRYIFHFGLYLPFLLSFLLCWHISGSLNNRTLLLFPLASYLLVTLPAASILVGESHILAAVAWPILLVLLKPRLTRLDMALALLLLFVMTRTYEATITSSLVLLGLLLARPLGDSRTSRAFILSASGLMSFAIALGIYRSTFPASGESRANFIDSLTDPVLHPANHPMFTLSAGSLFLLALCACRASSRALPILAVLVAAVSVLLAALGYAAGAGASFNMRALTLSVLPLLMLAAICFHAFRLDFSDPGWRLAGVVLSLLGIGYAASWAPWKGFRSSVVATLEANAGYVAVEDTVLAGNPHRWGWTMPLVSVLWSGGCVRTIVLNQLDQTWEPFDPRQSLPLQAYVAYSQPFAEASPDARSCR